MEQFFEFVVQKYMVRCFFSNVIDNEEQSLELHLVLFIALPAADMFPVIFFAAPIAAPVIVPFVILAPPELVRLPL